MSFFLSSTSSSKSDNYSKGNKQIGTCASHNVHPSWFIQPDPKDVSCQREVEVQRFKWKDFIKSKKISIWDPEMSWLWRRESVHKKTNNKFFLTKKLKETFNTKTIAKKELKALMRAGVPPELRGDVWWRLSGAEAKMMKASHTESFNYVSSPKAMLAMQKSPIAHDIEKDLNRTYTERKERIHDFPGFINSLRKLLIAYAVRNPKIGYCQSMNYVCALLLFHMDEDKAFWTFSALVEDIIPCNYYEPSLIGGRIDQQVFQSCIASRLPDVFAKFRETDTLLEPIICPWFLCIYINVLPHFTVCRIWDCLFWEGDQVIFRIGLTLVSSKIRDIMEAQDFIAIYSVMKSGGIPAFRLEHSEKNHPDGDDDLRDISDTQFLMNSTFGSKWLRFIPMNQIIALRLKFLNIMVEKNKSRDTDIETVSTTGTGMSKSTFSVGAVSGKKAVGNSKALADCSGRSGGSDNRSNNGRTLPLDLPDLAINSDGEVEVSQSQSSTLPSDSDGDPEGDADVQDIQNRQRTLSRAKRKSALLLASFGIGDEDVDVHQLHKLAKELDSSLGLSSHVEQFARELDDEKPGEGTPTSPDSRGESGTSSYNHRLTEIPSYQHEDEDEAEDEAN